MGEGQLTAWIDGLARPGGCVSAIEALVADAGGRVLFRHAAGFRRGGEPLPPGARFDAASLTKPWIATLALVLDAAGRLALDERIGTLWPEAEPRLARCTLEDLLRHRAGLAAWTPVGLRLGGRLADRTALERLLSSDEPRRETAPPGTYSDLGYILWGLAAEKSTGESLAALLDRHVCARLDLPALGGLAGSSGDVVECRLDNGREVELAAAQGLRLTRQGAHRRGEPQDTNARLLGFLTGHAGLFVTADELLALGVEWSRPRRLLSRAAVERALGGEGGWALGWARASDDGSSGPALSAAAFGHAGFTGGSLWIDPQRDRILVLLAHRLRSSVDFNPVRRHFHTLAP